METQISEEIAHVKGFPKKLIIYLHGYIDSAPSLDKKVSTVFDELDDFALHIPQAPIICEIHEKKRQWYSMHRFDPNDDRKFVATMEECMSFYDRMTLGLEEALSYLNPYIDQCLSEYQLTPQDLYLCGFSQGAMLAIYASLMREEKIGGCISFSGVMAGRPHLLKNAKSRPNFLLIHGNNDNLVRFEAQETTRKLLESLGCHTETYVVEGGQHMITDEGVEQASRFIHRHSLKEKAAI